MNETTAQVREFAPIAERTEFNAPAMQNISDLMLNIPMLQQIEKIAEHMAKNKTVPVHLRNSVADCYAVVMQAVQWRMNPFAVAQKTHISQSGLLGYEAQLVNAVVTTLLPGAKRPEFEFFGDWDKILGKVQERQSDKGGKYYVAAWDKKDEEGLGVTCRVEVRGYPKPFEITVKMSQCYPRFSTQWANDPQQQITYVAVRKLARRHFPDVILGVYTPEELDESRSERDITPAPEQRQSEAPQLPLYPDDVFQKNLPNWRASIESGKRTGEQLVATMSVKYSLTEQQIKTLSEIKIAEAETEGEEE